MTALLAFLRLAWPYLACLGVGLWTGGYLEQSRWEAKYEALQAGHAQELADAQAAGRKALQAQLDQFQATATNNARVINDLQNQTNQALADRARDRDLVQRLLDAAAQRGASYHTVPETPHQPGTASAGEPQGPDRLGDLLIAAADEARANARQCNALIEELKPQL